MEEDTSLSAMYRRAGATIGLWHGRPLPLAFENPASEYRALRTGVGLLDLSLLGLIHVHGQDRVGFLHNLLTNDMQALQPGAGVLSCLATPTGKLLADLVVLADESSHWLIADRTRIEPVIGTLNHYVITEDVTLEDERATLTVLGLCGPRSHELLTGLRLTPATLEHPFAHARGQLRDLPIHVVSRPLADVPGFWLIVAREQSERLWQALCERGGPAGLVPVGWKAFDALRIEAGLPWYGVDMDDSHLVPETGLERVAVSDSKGCYVGQEVIARLQTYGSASKRLMGLVCEGERVPETHAAIAKDGEPIGAVTSAAFSFNRHAPVALGYIKRPHYQPGTTVQIASPDRAIPATLVTPPFPSLG